MKTRQELENKAGELRKRIWDLEHNCWIISEQNKEKAELLKAAYAAILYALGYEAQSVYFDCNPYKLA